MARYSKSSQKEVEKEMHDFKRGKAKSGRGGKPVKSRKQAIAIGLSKARKKGAKVPQKPKAKTAGAKVKATKTKTKTRSRAKTKK